MMKYTKPAMEVKEFRAKETVASLSEWLAANGVDDANVLANIDGAVSYYAAS